MQKKIYEGIEFEIIELIDNDVVAMSGPDDPIFEDPYRFD